MKSLFDLLFRRGVKTPLDKSTKIPGPGDWFAIIESLSKTRKFLLFVFLVIFITSSIFLFKTFDEKFYEDIPAHGGDFVEGIVGVPRFINPVLATSDVDHDITEILYEGLLKANPDGSYSPALAKSINISEDGLEYKVELRDGLRWHDGEPITNSDVAYTVRLVADELVKSPLRGNWQGVDVALEGEDTVIFTLANEYSPFLENLTLGIMPEHIWGEISRDQITFSPSNLDPVGSGPFKLKKVKRDGNGIIRYMQFGSYNDYWDGEPYIDEITFYFYQNEDDMLDAYIKGDLDSIGGISPQNATWLEKQDGETNIIESPLPRVFAIFLNQNQSPVLLDKEVREALSVSIDKESLVNSILLGRATVIDGPLAPPYDIRIENEITSGTSTRSTLAEEILNGAGWSKNEAGIMEKTVNKQETTLSLSISTANSGDLRRAAEKVAEAWRSIGIEVNLKLFERGDLNQDVIRPRKYDSLLFGQVIGRYPDPFAFWHSSQRLDPGLNVALYTNSEVDEILEDIRTAKDPEQRMQKYQEFSETLTEEIPAIFLYSPNYIYLSPKEIEGITLDTRSGSSGRFSNIKDWYKYSTRTWK